MNTILLKDYYQPFTGTALAKAPSFLNPESKISFDWKKPARWCGRGAYALGVVCFVAPAGAIYHLYETMSWKSSLKIDPEQISIKLSARKAEHFKAAFKDLKAFVQGVFFTALAVVAAVATVFCYKESYLLGLILTGMASLASMYLSPVTGYMFAPDQLQACLHDTTARKLTGYQLLKGAGLEIQTDYLLLSQMGGVPAAASLVKWFLPPRALFTLNYYFLRQDLGKTTLYETCLKNYLDVLEELANQYKDLGDHPKVVKLMKPYIEDLQKLQTTPFKFLLTSDSFNPTLLHRINGLDRWINSPPKNSSTTN